MNEELPTKIELEQLYKEKGPNALVWYAWRNALRVSPLLGKYPLSEIWPETTVKYIFSVHHPLLILAHLMGTSTVKTHFLINFPPFSKRLTKVVDVAYMASVSAANAAKDAFSIGLYSRDETVINTLRAIIAAVDTYIAAEIGRSSPAAIEAGRKADRAAKESIVNLDFTPLAMSLASETYSDSRKDNRCVRSIIRAARTDFERLKHNTDKDITVNISLWHESENTKDEPNIFQPFEGELLRGLESLDLGFLAKDLECLWEGIPLAAHASNYIENFSDTITNDDYKLRDAILFGPQSLENLNTVRVLLLGSGGAGKTSLSTCLKGKEPTKTGYTATPGIAPTILRQTHLQSTHQWLEFQGENLELHIWDFGGQSIFYGLHRAFLHENCVYILVVDSRHEQAPDEWLQQIRDLSESPPHVLVVTNLYEKCEINQNEQRLLREFPSLLQSPKQFFYFSCHNPKEKEGHWQAFQVFLQFLVDEAMQSRHAVMKTTMDVQRLMSQQFEKRVLIDQEELEDLMPESASEKMCGDIEEDLKQLGYMIPVDSDGLVHCLKPDWALDNAYRLIRPNALAQVGGARGIISVKQVRKILGTNVETKDIKHLLDLLRSRAICQRLGNLEGDYFFPDAAPTDEPSSASKILSKQSEVLRVYFDLPYLPLGFHARLVNSLFTPNGKTSIQNTDDIWRQGFILRHHDSCAVVHYLYRKHLIEVVLSGSLHDFSLLLKKLLISMEKELTRGHWMKERHINSAVAWDEQLFSVHSVEELIMALGNIGSYDKLLKKGQSMAGKKIEVNVGNHSVVAIDAHNVKQRSGDAKHIMITTDQHQVMSEVFDEIFERRNNLSKQQVRQVLDLQDLLENEAETPSEAGQSALKNAWDELKSTIGAVNDGIGVATAVSQNWPTIIALLPTLSN